MSEKRRHPLEEFSEAARRKARELDEKYNLREKMEEGARAASDAARKGAEKLAENADRLQDELELKERGRRAAEDAARAAREAGEAFRQAGKEAGARAEEIFGDAREYYQRAARFYDVSSSFARGSVAAAAGLSRLHRWARENPKEAAIVTLSVVAGVRLGSSFPLLDAILLGSHPHWITHSALPVYALRKAGEKFDSYLKEREQLVALGNLDEAEKKQIEFERKIVKIVGAPLLGSFSCAVGLSLWAQILQPGRITGAPVSWLLGGNPVLDGIWLFSNGLICFHQGYKFFIMAFADEETVKDFVREVRGLLPA
jgi:hypothetical protein